MRPSDPAEADSRKVRTAELPEERARVLQHGTLVHRLLQSLPDIAAPSRHQAALAYLALIGRGLERGRTAGAG